METKKNIMDVERILPENFDGTFRFTNWTDEDFVGKWNGKEYHFPAGTTCPIIMHDQTPLEIQYIRKHFAKNLAEREFYKSEAYARLYKQEKNDDGTPRLTSMRQAGTYSIESLAPFIQKCLEPLKIAHVEVREAKKIPLEDKLTRNSDGELNTTAIDKKTSLKEKAILG